MAANSLREQIIVAVVTELEGISTIKTVERRLPSKQDLDNFAITQFPVIAVVSGLPKPVEHKVTRDPAAKDVFLSELKMELYGYFQDNVNPDTTLSSLLDDIWVALYADPGKGGLVIETDLMPEIHQDFWDPFYAFKLDVILKYKHTTGGI